MPATPSGLPAKGAAGDTRRRAGQDAAAACGPGQATPGRSERASGRGAQGAGRSSRAAPERGHALEGGAAQPRVRGLHPLSARHRALPRRAAAAQHGEGGAEQVTQLAEQHQRQLHRNCERDEPGERRRDMTRHATGAAGEARRVQAQRPGGGEQHGPAERDERDRHERVRPGTRQVRKLGDRRQRDQRRTGDDQQREQDRQQDLHGEQARGEQHADDHQERSEHAAGASEQRAAEQDADDPL